MKECRNKQCASSLGCGSILNASSGGWLIASEEELVFVYLADCTIAVFEEVKESPEESLRQRIPAPAFAESWMLTVGQLFSWLEE
jgi:hypothetical protein